MEYNKYHHSVKYRTKIVDLEAVNLVGKLEIRDDDGDFDYILISETRKYDISSWLEKFIGKNIRILIEDLEYSPDDSKLLSVEADAEDINLKDIESAGTLKEGEREKTPKSD